MFDCHCFFQVKKTNLNTFCNTYQPLSTIFPLPIKPVYISPSVQNSVHGQLISLSFYQQLLVHFFSPLYYSSSVPKNLLCSCINSLMVFLAFTLAFRILLFKSCFCLLFKFFSSTPSLSYLSFLFSSQDKFVTHPDTYIPFYLLVSFSFLHLVILLLHVVCSYLFVFLIQDTMKFQTASLYHY